ncbi:MAG: lamin tail domain-containing protein, partial [Thermoanaerobaculia bacterium]
MTLRRPAFLLLVFLFCFASLAHAASDVVISQVYGGGGNSGAPFKNDFIELFNRGTATVNLAGWSVQYASSSGTSWQVTPLTGSIAPGQYYLVREAAGSGSVPLLPTPDASGSISMSATAGKVALVASSSALTGTCPAGVVDFVGFGGANCFEGAGP